MIIPCIDLMGRKVVQLVQGKEKLLELPDPLAVLDKFKDFPMIQVIDLDAAMGRQTEQADIIRELCRRKPCRVGGGIRSVERALQIVNDGAHKVIVGSRAFTAQGINVGFLSTLLAALPREKIMVAVDCLGDHVAVRGWKETLALTSTEVFLNSSLTVRNSSALTSTRRASSRGPTSSGLENCARSRRSLSPQPGGITSNEEIQALEEIGMNAALGMAIYRKRFPEMFSERRAVL